MGGASGSNELMSTGRVNRSEDSTKIWAQRFEIDDGKSADFNGAAILVCEVAPVKQDDQVYENLNWAPQHAMDGIHGAGWSAGGSGGTGVVGFGGFNQGTGVLGQGGGLDGSGGIGIHGKGGESWGGQFTLQGPRPGAGVVGQGGRQLRNELRQPHGAGVIGIGGGSEGPLPSSAETGSVGVYAQGAEAAIRTEVIETVDTVVGPMSPGPGVVGRGGVFEPNDEHPDVAAGVVGLAGNTPIPTFQVTANAGVYGKGTYGVFGMVSVESGIGVRGLSEAGPALLGQAKARGGRGAQLDSTGSAQLWLVPQAFDGEFGQGGAQVATQVVRPGLRPPLPHDGLAGDLMVIRDQGGDARLWFCVRSRSTGPARWTEVLLGPEFDGEG